MTDAETVKQGLHDLANVINKMAGADAAKFAPQFFEKVPDKPLKVVLGYEEQKTKLYWEITLKIIKE